METKTISDIRDLHAKITQSLELYREYYRKSNTDMDSNSYGNEQEYCIKGIIAGVQNILTDISYLVRSHNFFIKISTYGERNNIKNQLASLYSYILSRNNAGVINQIETLKTLLRFYNIRIDKNRLVEFEAEIDNIRRLGNELSNDIHNVGLKLKSASDIYENIVKTQESYDKILSELKTRQDSLQNQLQLFTKDLSDFKDLAKRAQDNETSITKNLESCNRSKNIFDDFIAKISDRERMLKEQSDITNNYNATLEQYTNDYHSKMGDATRLIEEAKKALNYKNAEGLSAAFSTQLDSASSKTIVYGWLIGATVFILATLGIGIWIVITGWELDGTVDTGNNNQMIFNLIGRLSMVPFTVIGAVFCANQYTKQKNIIEDYAYKTTIAKSIIAFSEELKAKSPEQYAEYISTILKEIHQDPLRKRGKSSDEFKINKESSGIIEKVIDLLQSAINK